MLLASATELALSCAPRHHERHCIGSLSSHVRLKFSSRSATAQQHEHRRTEIYDRAKPTTALRCRLPHHAPPPLCSSVPSLYGIHCLSGSAPARRMPTLGGRPTTTSTSTSSISSLEPSPPKVSP